MLLPLIKTPWWSKPNIRPIKFGPKLDVVHLLSPAPNTLNFPLGPYSINYKIWYSWKSQLAHGPNPTFDPKSYPKYMGLWVLLWPYSINFKIRYKEIKSRLAHGPYITFHPLGLAQIMTLIVSLLPPRMHRIFSFTKALFYQFQNMYP